MRAHRWAAAVEPTDLGAVVHGPVVLARAPGIVAGLRCVFAHTDGLWLPFVLRAEGVQAEAATRQSFSGHLPLDETGPGTWSEPVVAIGVDGDEGFADASRSSGGGGEDSFDLDAGYWVDRVPSDGRLTVTVSWPQAGLPETRTDLVLSPWTAADVLPLL
ncbi:hypothetical protein [Kineococcus rhizosphaerae]|uniref:Uncharacterized protein n=1 Tax=Kineococcus rhizosphaerae TaxID=559628 RepID=A0A2T0R059_9ACTN|nr:hypothetical protein [Kineococcus rhizosphaerae]PRY12493.1 hypothetical protein CLV37_11053 [Kineococcus rhizosphaerae]